MRRVYRRAKPKEEKKFRANQQIRADRVMVIGAEGENLGMLPLAEAIARAQAEELDLVEVNPTGDVPIAKIMDYGQFKYEKDKLAQKQKSKSKKADTKMIRLSVRIGNHDFNVRIEQAKKFLVKGHKTRLELRLKGREKQHPEAAREVITRFVDIMKNNQEMNIDVDEPLTKQGGQFTIQLVNKGKKITNVK
ncbi:MAG: translation initiation factor IF-3 [bacterium]